MGEQQPMSSRGAFTLAEIAAKLTMLEVTCSRCERRGRLSLARLIERHGADASLGDLQSVIAHGCPRLNATSIYDRCGVHYPELPAVFLPPR